MEVSFLDLKEKEVINVFNGRKLGRICDLVFDTASGGILGIVVPGDKKIFRRGDDLFIPLDKFKRIGNDVILVGLQSDGMYSQGFHSEQNKKNAFTENFYGARHYESYREHGKTAVSLQNSMPVSENKSFGQIQSNASFVRMKPIASKKYK